MEDDYDEEAGLDSGLDHHLLPCSQVEHGLINLSINQLPALHFIRMTRIRVCNWFVSDDSISALSTTIKRVNEWERGKQTNRQIIIPPHNIGGRSRNRNIRWLRV